MTRWRLAPGPPGGMRPSSQIPHPSAPILLVLPAHNEEGAIGGVLERVPAEVAGHPVTVLVVDDGSTDRTAEVARAAGVKVASHKANQGLGAAVRTGLTWAAEQRPRPAAVAFCDADGEYAPEQLDQMVAPILNGDADYVIGSRFAGDIKRMRWWRRIGNNVLTLWVRWMTRRTDITDGQSGYRALSAEAVAAAEIVHDYNYAQVLTLDLLAKGYRYAEVPISYSFRETGRSFVRLDRYVQHVTPGVRRELGSRVSQDGAVGPPPWASLLWLWFAVPAVLGCVAVGWAAIDPTPAWAVGRLDGVQPWLAQDSPGVPGATLVLIAAAAGSYAYVRQDQGRAIGLLVAAGLAVLGSSLGLVAYLQCPDGRPPLIGPIGSTLGLFFGTAVACSEGTPLALTLAGILCLAASLVGVVAFAATLWRRQLDLARARLARNVTVVVGLNPASLDFIRSLTAERGAVHVLEPDSTTPHLEEAREAGARVVTVDPTSASALEPILTWFGRPTLRRAYLLNADSTANERSLAAIKRVLATRGTPTSRPSLVVRVDDPREAADWRGEHLDDCEFWLEDAVSAIETTAATLVTRLVDAHLPGTRVEPVERVLVCGDSAMTLALLCELAHLAWEREQLRAAGPPREGDPPDGWCVSEVDICSDRAESIKTEFTRSVTESMRAALGAVTVRAGSWFEAAVAALTAPAQSTKAVPLSRTVVIVAAEPGAGAANLAGRLGRLFPVVRVVELTDDAGDRGSQNIGVTKVRLALVSGDSRAETVWDRLARHNHTTYVRRKGTPPPERMWSRGPWDGGLSSFVREDNVLQIRRAMVEVGRHERRRWVHSSRVVPGSQVDLSAGQWLAIARAEHIRWSARRLAAGWRVTRPDETDDDLIRANQFVKAWHELDATDGNVEHIRSIIDLLASISYVPAIPPGGPEAAQSYARFGEVDAELLTVPESWRTSRGDVMQGAAGDWKVTEGDESWTVSPGVFTTTYQQVGDGRYRRIGTVRAWQVVEDTVVHSLEGVVTAMAGDWILEGVNGERWAMRHHEFGARYRPTAAPGRPVGSAAAGTVYR